MYTERPRKALLNYQEKVIKNIVYYFPTCNQTKAIVKRISLLPYLFFLPFFPIISALNSDYVSCK